MLHPDEPGFERARKGQGPDDASNAINYIQPGEPEYCAVPSSPGSASSGIYQIILIFFFAVV